MYKTGYASRIYQHVVQHIPPARYICVHNRSILDLELVYAKISLSLYSYYEIVENTYPNKM